MRWRTDVRSMTANRSINVKASKRMEHVFLLLDLLSRQKDRALTTVVVWS